MSFGKEKLFLLPSFLYPVRHALSREGLIPRRGWGGAQLRTSAESARRPTSSAVNGDGPFCASDCREPVLRVRVRVRVRHPGAGFRGNYEPGFCGSCEQAFAEPTAPTDGH